MLWLDTLPVQIMYIIARIPCDTFQDFLKSLQIEMMFLFSKTDLPNWYIYLEILDFFRL